MLTAEHVRARKRAGKLHLTPLKERGRAVALTCAQAYLTRAQASVGRSRGELTRLLDEVAVSARDRKIALGIRKLVEDQCEFVEPTDLDAVRVRQTVFVKAAVARRDLKPGFRLDRAEVLRDAALDLGVGSDEIEVALYADLKQAQTLRQLNASDPGELVERYEVSQAQAVLLRAIRVEAWVRSSDPQYYRDLFRKLKFRRLLHTIHPDEGGYRIVVDGPMSLFSSATKYGLSLALLLPAIQAGSRWAIDAELLWGARRERLSFQLSGDARTDDHGSTEPPHEVTRLVERWPRLQSPWQVAPAAEVLDLPGVGLTVPDLAFTHQETGEVVYLEVLGFWSREAVWRRVELVEAGLPARIVFAVSSTLRVSQDVLAENLPAALYVFKRSIEPKALLERLDAVAARSPGRVAVLGGAVDTESGLR